MSPLRLAGLIAVLLVAAVGGALLLGHRRHDPGVGGAASTGRPATPKPVPPAVTLGAWRFRADLANRGLAAHWWRSPPPMRPVTVPGVPDARHVSGPRGLRAQQGEVGWWRAPLTVTRAGLYAIDVGSANRIATMWVDNQRRCTHVGAYRSFRCLARLRPGAHHVTLRLDWRDPQAARNKAQGRGWFNWGGLAWPISVVPVGRAELDGPRVWTALHHGSRTAMLHVAVDVIGHGVTTGASGTATLTDPDGTQVAAVPLHAPKGAGILDHHTLTLSARIPVPHAQLWAPGHPARYRLTLTSPGAPDLTLRVGLRTIGWRTGVLTLNGSRLHLRGAELPPDAAGHGDALTAADQNRIVSELRAIGANAARAQFPLSDALLSRLDAAGILVWQQIGPWDPAGDFRARTPALQAFATGQALADARREQPHPSVLTWTLSNEAAGQGSPYGQAAYVTRTARRLHALDPSRPVSLDLWGLHPPRADGPLFAAVDALGVSDYTGWYEALGASGAVQDAMSSALILGLRRLFPAKPLVISEFGATANRLNARAAPGGLGFQAALLARKARFYTGVHGLSGALVFALRDYAYRPDYSGGSIRPGLPPLRITAGFNEKGLFTPGGTAKPAVAALRAAFGRAGRQ